MPSKDFKKYLTTEILSEQRTVTYRLLARALRVHVNAAKCMLYEFYEEEIRRKPGSVYVTYLISGVKKGEAVPQSNGVNGHNVESQDDAMPPSSPPPFTSSMLDPSEPGSQHPPTSQAVHSAAKAITLVREEQLDSVRQQYQAISCVHIYSISPGRIPDINALSDTNRSLYADHFRKEDPLIHNKDFGVIINAQVRRRTGKRPVIPDAPVAPQPDIKATSRKENQSANVTRDSSAGTKEPSESKRPGSSGKTAAALSGAKPPVLKRDSSDFFKKAFGGAKSKTKQPISAASSQKKEGASQEDARMFSDNDDDAQSDDSALFLDTGKRRTSNKRSSAEASEIIEDRKDKAAKLRKMMDSDDEEEKPVPKTEDGAGLSQDKVEADEDEDEEKGAAWSESETESTTVAPAAPPEKGRRRGKRKVMKKRTTKDEEGYLVTKEEAVWESFSESEPEQKPTKAKPSVPANSGQARSKISNTPSASAPAAKAKGKPDIMKFFGKK